MPGFFEKLATDDRRIAMDCDVVAGFWPARADIDGSPEAIDRLLERGGIDGALVSSGQAICYDEAGGFDEVQPWLRGRNWRHCQAVNLRDAIGIGERLDMWMAAGVRAIRLPGVTQGVPTNAPGYQLVVEEAVERDLLMLVEGGFNQVQGAFRGKGAKVIFLDAGFYETADFIIAVEGEPNFAASTRRILGPNAIELICEKAGADHLAFGTGSPLWDLEPIIWRLRDARISDDDFTAIAGGTLQRLLGGGDA